ncbi:hypothetical protein HYR69_03350, partial [Candidatus Sumerlaeota bacterium]|nr:hypothetical protein [Candidatus Sumerlaeota bacterium]
MNPHPRITTSGTGIWIATWYGWRNFAEPASGDSDVLFSLSLGNSTAWSNARLLNPWGNTDSQNSLQVDDVPEGVDSDGMGLWIVVFYSTRQPDGSVGDDDIYMTKSLDNGQTWSYPQPLINAFATDVGFDGRPEIVTDRLGNWIIV